MLSRHNLDFSANKSQLYALLMALTTVLLFHLAFPSVGYGHIAWIALVPAFIALNKMNSRNAFMLGLLAATLGWLSSIWWATYGIAEITSSSINLALPVVFFFCLLSAVPYGLASLIHVHLNLGRSAFGALASSVILTAIICYIPQILPGNLTHALYLKPTFIQLADIGGVALVCFIVNCTNILIANGISLFKPSPKKALQCFSLAILIFTGNACYGYYKTATPSPVNLPTEKSIKVAIIQPNISITNRTRVDWLKEQKNIQQLLINVSNEKDINLIVFPEVPVPISYQFYSQDKKFFDKFLPDTPLLLTAIKPVKTFIDESSGYFNTMELIDSQAVSQNYSKQMLLPFGEYLPYEEQMPWLRKVFPFAPNYKPGSETRLFSLNSNDDQYKAIPLICYEAIFSDLVAKGVEQGGEFIINSSNDAWFAHPAGKKVHLALSLFRTIEYRQYLIRTTNTGLSGVIDPYGRFIEKSLIKPNTQGYSVIKLPIEKISSFYQKHPNLIKYIFLCLIPIIFIYFRKLHGRDKETN